MATTRSQILSNLGLTEDGVEEAVKAVERRKKVFGATTLPPSFKVSSTDVEQTVGDSADADSSEVGDYTLHRFQCVREESQMAISGDPIDWVVTDVSPIAEQITLKDEHWNKRVVSYVDFIDGNYEPKVADDGTPIFRY